MDGDDYFWDRQLDGVVPGTTASSGGSGSQTPGVVALAILAILVALAFQVMAFMVRRGLRSRHRSFELGRR